MIGCALPQRNGPDAVAIVCGNSTITYSELEVRTNQLAPQAADTRRTTRKDFVGVCAANVRSRWWWRLLGILKAGGAYVPLDPVNPDDRLSFIAADARVRVLLTQEHLAGRVDAPAPVEQPPAGERQPEPHQMVNKFRYKPSGITYVAHRTAARSMQAEAEANKEVTSEVWVVGSGAAGVRAVAGSVRRGREARQRRTRGAHRGHETARGARDGGTADRAGMDGRNRYRFKNGEQVLGAWVNASAVRGRAVGSASEETPGPAPTPEAGGDVRPAA